jgi:hypothetical protein
MGIYMYVHMYYICDISLTPQYISTFKHKTTFMGVWNCFILEHPNRGVSNETYIILNMYKTLFTTKPNISPSSH